MSEDQAVPLKRKRGRPPKQKSAGIEREPQREVQQKAGKSIKMRAKPNWEQIDPNAVDTADRLAVPAHLIPEGMSLQWVTSRVYGQEMARHRADFERRGWTPVHGEDFDGQLDGMFMPKGADGEIEIDGLVLMARPKQITEAATKNDTIRARQQVLKKEAEMRGGDVQGISLDTTHPTALRVNKVGRSVERIDVPSE